MNILRDLVFLLVFLLFVYYSVKYFILKSKYEKLIEHFTDALVHDLKTPTLAQLRGVELIQNEMMGQLNPEQQEFMAQINESCKYTLDMISMLLKTYRMERGNHLLTIEVFSLRELLEECVEELSSKVQEKELDFVYEQRCENSFIEADKGDIRTVLLYLLRNIVIYSNRNEKFIVSFHLKSNKLEMEIKGRGIFLASRYMSENLNYAPIGENIGFYLSKKIVKSYNGSFSVFADGENSGKFALSLPLKNPAFA